MHPHDECRHFPNRGLVIGQARFVGRANFAQARAARSHHIWQPIGAADFDELTARDDNFLIARQRRQHQHRGGSVVVHDERVFRTRELAQQQLGIVTATTAQTVI